MEQRELTEQELGYLGWEFEPVGITAVHVTLNSLFIWSDDKDVAIDRVNRIARAQGITPPAFSVGQRVTITDYGYAGTIKEVVWFGDWIYAVSPVNSDHAEQFTEGELEKLTDDH